MNRTNTLLLVAALLTLGCSSEPDSRPIEEGNNMMSSSDQGSLDMKEDPVDLGQDLGGKADQGREEEMGSSDPDMDQADMNDPVDMAEDMSDPADMMQDMGSMDMATTPDMSPGVPIRQDVRSYMFGHSLLVHATASDETTVPHWLGQLATGAGYSYRADGQYGFLLQHDDLPPRPQWGFQQVQGSWQEGNPFASADFNVVLLTAANFVQYKPSTEPYDGDNPQQESPVGATTTIVDWVEQQEPGLQVYIYENWPDMGGYLNAGFPPSPQELASYNSYTLGDFHQWWLDYHDAVRAASPGADVKMIPVGPTIAKLLALPSLSSIPANDLYEDDAPHGRATIYFLAALVTYQAIYGVPAPEMFNIPGTVHADVRSNYMSILTFIDSELAAFTDANGNSRVY